MKNKTKEMEKLIYELNNHKLFNSSKDLTKDHLKIFMEHHVYVVWDFMSIVKSLQHHICPHTVPWKPSPYSKFGLTHLINEIVFNEESDIDNFGDYKSHFELYIDAMEEIGANTKNIVKFTSLYPTQKSRAIKENLIPSVSLNFVDKTFEILNSKKLHNIAGIFTYGRETVIPNMFNSIITKIENNNDCDTLKYYLNRHINIDDARHGPLSVKLFDIICNQDNNLIQEAHEKVCEVIELRIKIWDEVYNYI